jgi:transcriptional regulator with XRE-family HTH domain
MSTVSTCTIVGSASPATLPLADLRTESATRPARPLHRLAEVRRQEGMADCAIARRLGVPIREVRRQEQPNCDLRLSELYRWEEALQVPATELLSEPEVELSPPVELRAMLVRVMKTARSIEERTQQASVRRLVKTLVDQMLAVMPELKDTLAWPTVGHQRKRHDLGQAFFRRLPADLLDEVERPW